MIEQTARFTMTSGNRKAALEINRDAVPLSPSEGERD